MTSPRVPWLNGLREARWLDGGRARAYCTILFAVSAAGMLGWVAFARHGLDATGKPLGTDFLSFWAASRLALAGAPAAAYDVAAHRAVQNAVFLGSDPGYFAFFYPPVYLLICWPLALLPYLASLAVWLLLTGWAYVQVIGRMLGSSWRDRLPVLAFPAVVIALGHGQNAFLLTALMGAALLAMPKRPALAGVLFGLMIVKPQLGLLIPIYFVVRGSWTTILAAVATAAAVVGLSVAGLGIATWRAFLLAAPMARAALEQDRVGPEKMQSVFAAVRLLHGSVPAAYAAQGIVAALAACALVIAVRRGAAAEALGPILVCATLLATPFVLDYDLLLLSIPLAWATADARRTGFLPWEKLVLGTAFLLPLVSRLCATVLSIPLGPPILACLLAVLMRRALRGPARVAAARPTAMLVVLPA